MFHRYPDVIRGRPLIVTVEDSKTSFLLIYELFWFCFEDPMTGRKYLKYFYGLVLCGYQYGGSLRVVLELSVS